MKRAVVARAFSRASSFHIRKLRSGRAAAASKLRTGTTFAASGLSPIIRNIVFNFVPVKCDCDKKMSRCGATGGNLKTVGECAMPDFSSASRPLYILLWFACACACRIGMATWDKEFGGNGRCPHMAGTRENQGFVHCGEHLYNFLFENASILQKLKKKLGAFRRRISWHGVC